MLRACMTKSVLLFVVLCIVYRYLSVQVLEERLNECKLVTQEVVVESGE